jgi:hypothetical protein
MARRKRRSPTELEKRASTALSVRAGDGKFILPRRECKGMTPREILREFDRRVIYAHGAADANGGSMHPTNLWPTRRDEDARETRRDISTIAKGKRIAAALAAHKAAMTAKLMPIDVTGARDDGFNAPAERRPQPKRRWPKRKMQSRPFSRQKRGFRR